MTRIVALIPDLLFGSRVQASLQAAGHEVELVSGSGGLDERLADADVLVLDLTNEDLDGPALVEALSAEGTLDADAHPWASTRTWTRLCASVPSRLDSISWYPARAWPARVLSLSDVWLVS